MRTSPLRGEHAWLLVPDRALPFDPMEFPQDCKAGLVGDVEYGVPVYDLFLVEDPVTRPFVIYKHGLRRGVFPGRSDGVQYSGDRKGRSRAQRFTLVEIADTGVTIRSTKTGTYPPEPRFDWALTFRDVDPTNGMVAAEAVHGSHYDGYRTNDHWLGAGQSVTTQAGGVYTIRTVSSDHVGFTKYTDNTTDLGATLGMGNLSYLEVSGIDHPDHEVTFVYRIPEKVALLLGSFMT